jgi:pyruvate formate lyase activating enzyme
MKTQSLFSQTKNANPARSGHGSWDISGQFHPSTAANKANITNGNALLNRNAASLRIGGLARLSACDWPGQLTATVFCQGCAWDCPYCHNPGLRLAEAEQLIPWSSILNFLAGRRGLLDAVVFSGGEPTIQDSLLNAIQEVRKLGFRIGLHTAGMMPDRLATLLPFLDWVGFDVKAPFAVYDRITGVTHSAERARKSLCCLLASRVFYEIRTTLHPALLSLQEMLTLQDELLGLGVTCFAVQHFRPQGARTGLLPPASAYPLPDYYGNKFRNFTIR